MRPVAIPVAVAVPAHGTTDQIHATRTLSCADGGLRSVDCGPQLRWMQFTVSAMICTDKGDLP